MICFTPNTRIATPEGPVLVRDLAEDDLILTKDDGPQPIRWIGWRRMSGARMFAMPELRPIRIRGGALGLDVPDDDLLVSPKHRLVIKGGVAQALFNTPEGLVAARDLLNDHSVTVDRRVNDVTYVHLLLDRHQVVFANGVEIFLRLDTAEGEVEADVVAVSVLPGFIRSTVRRWHAARDGHPSEHWRFDFAAIAAWRQ